MSIRFGGAADEFIRLDRLSFGEVPADTTWVGGYACADADASAEIGEGLGSLQIKFRGRNGGWTSSLKPIGERVFTAEGDQAGRVFPIAPTFDPKGRGFHLNGPRTRNLRFSRSD